LSVALTTIPTDFIDPKVLLINYPISNRELIPPIPLDPTYKLKINNGIIYHKFTIEDTYVTPNDPTKEYQSRQYLKKNVIQWGQRKLGLALIQFLVKYLPEFRPLVEGSRPIVIYAGAAPGENIAFAAKFFKNVVFHLYDPRDYSINLNDPSVYLYQDDAGIKPEHRIILHTGKTQGMFTDDTARKWSEHQKTYGGVYFVSDIRSVGHDKQTMQEFEEGVWRDMTAQARWHRIIRPVRSQFKFRLPYDLGTNSSIRQMFPDMKIPYLPGIIYKGIYNKPTSTESRLVTSGNSIDDVLYDFKEYESKMFYFNTEVKEKFQFLNLLDDSFEPEYPPELLNDYNSTAETFIWIDLLKYLGFPINKDNIKWFCDNFSKALSVGKEKTLSSERK